LEFTPAGGTEAVQAVDRIDSGSVNALAPGTKVEVVYPAGQPRAALMRQGTRTYARDLLMYVLQLTYGIAAALLLLGWPLLRLFNRLGRVFAPDPKQLEARLAGLLPDDPRRRMMEERLRALREAEARRNHGSP
jgi:hypothetical protein